jgi:Fis family transcriptional regulator
MTKERRSGPIAACVRNSMERYFRELDGHKTTGVYSMVLAEMEKPLFEAVMKHARGNQCRAADILGINRNTLRTKLRRYKIPV